MTRRAYAFSDKVCNFRISEDRPNPTTLGPTGFPYGQNGNEERIAKILSEANKAMAAGVAASAQAQATSKENISGGNGLPISTSGGLVSNQKQ